MTHEKKPILVSECLLGQPCRYDGASKPCQSVIDLHKRYHLVPACPEQLGGLPTPRTPSELVGDRVISRDGHDRTKAFRDGALEALRLARKNGCTAAILKAKSPSCGVGPVYDGTFTGTLTDGMGVTARLLADHGIQVLDENHLQALQN